jgi:hypothetical protein
MADSWANDATADMKFLADDMLGRLAKWLRILGYDTVYVSGISDDELLRLAVREGRILLTRDLELAQKTPKGNCLFIRSHGYWTQLKEVLEGLELKVRSSRLFSICLECNTQVAKVTKKNLKGRMPSYAYAHHKTFWQCPHCCKIFWRGSHYENTLKRLEGLKLPA